MNIKIDSEIIDNVTYKHVIYIKDVEWRGGGKYMNIQLAWVFIKMANLHILGSGTKLNKSKTLWAIL